MKFWLNPLPVNGIGGVSVVDCPTCEEPLEDEEKSTVVCSICAQEIHRSCAKKLSGSWYCKSCKREAKKRSRYEKMARKDQSFGR